MTLPATTNRHSSRRLASSVCLGLTLLLHGGAALGQAGDVGQTEQVVTEVVRTAVERYAKHDLEGARDAFEKAWNLRQHAAIAASLAEVEVKLGRYRDAAGHLSFYLAHVPVGKEGSRADAEQQLNECLEHVGRLRVTVFPAESTLLLDGVTVGRGPAFDLFVEPGTHSLRAEHDGRSSPLQRPTVERKETLNARLDVAPPPPRTSGQDTGRPTAARQARGDQPSDGSDAKFWVLTAGATLSGAAVATGVLYALQARTEDAGADSLLSDIQRRSDYSRVAKGGECNAVPRPAACDGLARQRDDARADRRIALVSFIGAGVLGLATVGAQLFWPQPAPAGAARVSLDLWATPSRQGLTIRGTF